MPELNSIDDFFRRKEQESSTVNDNMHAHWKEMNRLLKNPSTPAIPAARSINIKKFLPYAAAAIVIIVSSLFLVPGGNKSAEQADQLINKPSEKKEISATIVPVTKDSLPNSNVSNKNTIIVVKKESKGVNSKTEKSFVTKPETERVDFVTTAIPVTDRNKLDDKKLFTTFFDELEKPAEKFVIDVSKDTVLVSKEGTGLTIPANAFVDASGQLIRRTVTIYLQEFYKLSDIISNKLTTMSNDKPLVTGGMFNIIADAGGQQVKINPAQPLTLTIPAKSFDPFMQLFKGEQRSPVLEADTVKNELQVRDNFMSLSGAGINWIAAGQPQYSMISTKNRDITILNLRDNPYHISSGKKVVGYFELPYDSRLSKEEMKAELEKRYSKWYDVIKVRKQWRPWSKKNRVPSKDVWYDTQKVGDSIMVSLRLATRLKMITKEDSLAYEAEFKRQYDLAVKQEIARSEWIQKKSEYSFTVTDLGWINCDRFLNYPGRKLTDFVLNPGNEFSESYLYSVLIFSDQNSIMPGLWVNGKIVFQRIPVGSYVSVISIGVKNGKTWACVQPAYVQKEEVNKMFFEETSPEQLKRKLQRFGNVSGLN